MTTRKRIPSDYKGVRWVPALSKWRAKIKVHRVNYVLGYYETAAEASAIYQNAKKALNHDYEAFRSFALAHDPGED